MALPPVKPSESEAIVPQPGDAACSILSNMTQMLTQWNAYIQWAINEDGSATQDMIDWIGTGGTSALAAPTGVLATDSRTTDITVTWNAVSDAAYYVVYRGSTSDTSAMTPVSGNLTDLSYVDTSTSSDVTVWYSVRAYSSAKISALATPDSGIRPTSAAPSEIGFTYAASDYEYVVPTGFTTMELLMWGSGGVGGHGQGAAWVPVGGELKAGGGGGGGSFLHITGVSVTPGESYFIRIGKKLAAGNDGATYVWRDAVFDSEYAQATAGSDGANGNYASAGAGGPALSAGGWGTNALGSGSIDSSGGDSSAIGAAGSAGSGTTGGAGASGITQSGITAGAGGTGVQLYNSSTTPTTYGGAGYVLLRFT